MHKYLPIFIFVAMAVASLFLVFLSIEDRGPAIPPDEAAQAKVVEHLGGTPLAPADGLAFYNGNERFLVLRHDGTVEYTGSPDEKTRLFLETLREVYPHFCRQ